MSTDPKSGPPNRNDQSDRSERSTSSPGRLPSGGWTIGPWDDELPDLAGGAEPTPDPAADTSLGERALDLGAIARSMSAISRPSLRRESGQHERVPLPPSTVGRPGLPPSPRRPAALDDNDRGVSVPLPPGLMGVARPSPGVLRSNGAGGDWERSPTRATENTVPGGTDFLAESAANKPASNEDSGGGPWRAGSGAKAPTLPQIGHSDPNFSELPLNPESLFGGDAEDEFLLVDAEPEPEPEAAPAPAAAPPRRTMKPPELPDPNDTTMFGIAAATLDRVGSSPRIATIAPSDDLMESIDVLMEMPASEVTEHDPSSATVVPLDGDDGDENLVQSDEFDGLPSWTDPLQRLPVDGDSSPGEADAGQDAASSDEELSDDDVEPLADWQDEMPSLPDIRPPDTDRGLRRVSATTLEVEMTLSSMGVTPAEESSESVAADAPAEDGESSEVPAPSGSTTRPAADTRSVVVAPMPDAAVTTPPNTRQTQETEPYVGQDPTTAETTEVAPAGVADDADAIADDAAAPVNDPALETITADADSTEASAEESDSQAEIADAALNEEPEMDAQDEADVPGEEFERGNETRIEARPAMPEESESRRVVVATGAAIAVSELIELPLPEPSARAELRLDPTTAHHSNVWMNEEERFDALADSLRKAGRWPALAAVLAAVIDGAPFARGPRRTELLRELGQLGRDRLAHDALAEESFVALLRLQPGDDEAYQHLLVLYESRSDVRSRTILELHTVPGLSSAAEQLARTARAAINAAEHLQDPDLAIAGWEQLLSLGRHAEECTVALGRLYRLRARWDSLAALVDATAARTTGGARWLSLRLLANIHSRARGDAAGAANALQDILKDRSNDLPARLMLVEQLAALGDIDALAALPSDLDENPSQSEVRAIRRTAEILWEHGRHQDASEAYQTLAQAGLASSNEQDRIDEWRAEVGLHTLRVEELEQRSAVEPQASELLARAADVSASKLEDFDRATQLMRQAVEKQPSLASFHLLRGFAARAGRVEERRFAINACLKSESDTAQRVALLIELADCEEPVDRAAARAALQRAVDLSADSGVRERLVTMCMEDGDREAAVHLLQTGARRSTDASEVAELRERIAELVAAEPEAALDAWQEVLVYRPTSNDAFRQLETLMLATPRGRGRALALAGQLDGSAAESLDHMLVMASAWQGAGGFPESAAVLEQVLAIDPGHADALDALVMLYETSDQQVLARVALETAAFHADGTARVGLLRRAQALVAEDAVAERWSYERRIGWLNVGNAPLEASLVPLAEKAGELAALVSLRRHAWATADADGRDPLSDALVALLTGVADDPRAALAHVRARVDLRSAEAPELESIRKLCAKCDDYSTLLELLEQRVLRARTNEDRAAALDALAEELLRLERYAAAIEALYRAVVVAGDDETRMARIEEIAQQHDLLRLRDQILLEVAITVDGARRAALLNQWADSSVNLPAASRFARRMLAARLAGLTGQRMVELSGDASSLELWPWVCAYFEADARCRESESERHTALAAVAAAMAGSPKCAERELELQGELLLAEPGSAAHASALVERARSLGRQPEARRWLRSAAEKSDDRTAMGLLESAWSLASDTAERSVIAEQMLLHDPDHGASLALMAELAEARKDYLVFRSVLLRQASLEETPAARARLLEKAAAVSAANLEEPRRAIELYDEAIALDAHVDASAARVALVETHGTQQERLELARKRADEDGESAVGRLLELVAMQRASGSLDDALDSLTLAYERGADVWDELSVELERAGRTDTLLDLRLKRARGMNAGAERGDAFGECLSLLTTDAPAELREEVLREAAASAAHGPRARAALTELLLSAGRYEELRDGLSERVVSSGVETRLDLQITLARIQQFNLQEPDASLDLWLDVQGEHAENTTSLLALAALAEAREDYARAFDWRYQYAHLLVPRDGALALCALAEYCDDHKVHTDRIADLYREARRLDPWCTPSSEALKGISRRLSSLRPKAALLEEEGEGAMTAAARAARLHELAGGQTDSAAETDMLRRAVALDPVRWQAWLRLAELDAGNMPEDYYRYTLAAWNAWRLTQPLGEEQTQKDTELGWTAAMAASKAGDQEAFRTICHAIHLVAPTYLPAAQVIARAALEQGDAEAALTIVAPMAGRAKESTDPALVSLFGDIYAATGNAEQAQTWHRRAVELRPLASGSLAALAREARQAGDFAGYHNLVLGSLTGESEPDVHAERLYELAQELQTRNESAEATACYEEAFTWGQRDPELLERLYAQYQTQAAGPRGRAVIEALLDSGVTEERARVLHLSLGRLLVEQGDDLGSAAAHLQAVLDADDDAHEARSLLAVAFEKSGDVAGLRRVLQELAERASGRAAADAWLRLGAMHAEVGDAANEMLCLERSVDAFPTAPAMRSLEAAWSESEPGSARRRTNLARLAEVDDVCWPHVLAAARPLLDADPVVGWCALSPLLMTRQGEDELRARLREMRRDHERPPIRVAAALQPTEWLPAQTSEQAQSLIRALAVLESSGLKLNESAADVGADEVFEVSPHSSIGRTFLTVAAEFGLNDVCLYRAGVLPQAFMHWHSGTTLNVVVRADVFQSMARAEVGFVLVGLLVQATAAGHSLAGLSHQRHAGFGAAIAAWLQDSPSSSADEQVLIALSGLPDSARESVAAIAPAAAWTAEVVTAAAFALTQQMLRRALIGGPDLYQAGRALARMNNDAGRATSFADLGELDSTILSDEQFRLLAAFTVTEAFAKALRAAAEVSN